MAICIFYALRNQKLTWTSINVSTTTQGDAHLISKGNKHFLIDTGAHKVVDTTLLPYLKKHNITDIEAVLITHPHFDHYGGLISLLENNITISKVYMNIPTPEQMHREWWGGEYKHMNYIKEYTKKYAVPLLSISKGLKLVFNEKSYIEVLYIYDGINTPIGSTDINDMSAITMLYDDKNKFLLTGDLNMRLGTYLAENANDIQAPILKAPHHGAKSLAPNSFFKKVDPKVLIVPAPAGLWCSDRSKRLREFSKEEGYETYINGIHGHITVTSHENKTIITTEKSPKEICKEVQ
ncbi:metallo-beta-lactamase family protein [hydrothermal vent metagenome]|uniref:Metallo-beta-lactamase family protein n=1 Tax=hydrothermal vent metagenome TaxID=652676 RepID=A0A1W1CBA4_9ZZZZ